MDEKQLKYRSTHEWIEPSGPKRKVGISNFAQEQLGDIVYVEFPALGKTFAAGEELAVIESCKATAAVYAPVAGKLNAVNTNLANDPALVNTSPFGDGWLFELEIADDADESGLLDHAAYARQNAEGE